jgi:hypothetical protein
LRRGNLAGRLGGRRRFFVFTQGNGHTAQVNGWTALRRCVWHGVPFSHSRERVRDAVGIPPVYIVRMTERPLRLDEPADGAIPDHALKELQLARRKTLRSEGS